MRHNVAAATNVGMRTCACSCVRVRACACVSASTLYWLSTCKRLVLKRRYLAAALRILPKSKA